MAWAAWRLYEPGNSFAQPYVLAGELSRDGKHLLWAFSRVPVAPFALDGGLAVTPDGSTAVILWGHLSSAVSPNAHARLAVVKDHVLWEGTVHDFGTTSACRVSAPLISASGTQVLASAQCPDGRALLFGASWILRLPGKAIGLPAFALDASGTIGLVAWPTISGTHATYSIETIKLTW